MRNNEEERLQIEFRKWMERFAVPGTECWAVNNNPRNVIHGAQQKRMGVKAGVADWHFFRDGRYAALELKTLKGRATMAQIEWLDRINKQGGRAAIAYGLEAAIKYAREWGYSK